MPRKLGWNGLQAPEPLVSNGDDLAVGQLVGLLQRAGGGGRGHLLLEIKGNIAEFLLDVPDDLPLSSGGEAVSPLSEDLHQVVGEVTASKVESEDGESADSGDSDEESNYKESVGNQDEACQEDHTPRTDKPKSGKGGTPQLERLEENNGRDETKPITEGPIIE